MVPHAIAYYRELERQGEVVYHVSPYSSGKNRVAFNFDWTFDYYPLAFHRPGPEMTIYRLHGGRCASWLPRAILRKSIVASYSFASTPSSKATSRSGRPESVAFLTIVVPLS